MLGSAEVTPVQAAGWSGRRGLILQGCCGDRIWGVSGYKGNELLESWKWQAGRLEKEPLVEFSGKPKVYDVCLIAGGCYLTYENHGGPGSTDIILIANDIESGAETRRWTREDITQSAKTRSVADMWALRVMNSSASGSYVALAYSRPTDVLEPCYKIRLLDASTLTFCDVMLLGGDGKHYGDNVRRVVPSDDGAYVAVAGWENGVAMMDARQKKFLWSKRPPSEISMTYAVFGPGNALVYGGGSEGCVYEMAVADGKVLGRWFASPTGKSEYGHRISALAVSPDGQYVAAGTGPQGLIFVIDPKSGKTVKVLNHGGSTISLVHFSPDSKRLASLAAGVLKVWQIGGQ